MTHEEVIEMLVAVSQRSKSNQHRLDELEKRQDDLSELVGVVKVLVDRLGRVEGDVKETRDDVKKLAQKPGKRLDKLWEIIITVVVGAVVGFVLAKLGL